MKLMRSRFRLLALLMACAFFLAAVLCAGKLLRDAGISVSSVPDSLRNAVRNVLPDTVSSPPGEEPSPAPSGDVPPGTPAPGDALSPDPVYNVFGL